VKFDIRDLHIMLFLSLYEFCGSRIREACTFLIGMKLSDDVY
jgi:hypothetical protein